MHGRQVSHVALSGARLSMPTLRTAVVQRRRDPDAWIVRHHAPWLSGRRRNRTVATHHDDRQRYSHRQRLHSKWAEGWVGQVRDEASVDAAPARLLRYELRFGDAGVVMWRLQRRTRRTRRSRCAAVAGARDVQRGGEGFAREYKVVGIHGRVSFAHRRWREDYLVGLSRRSFSTQSGPAHRSHLDHGPPRAAQRSHLDRHGATYLGKTLRPRSGHHRDYLATKRHKRHKRHKRGES